MLYTIHISCSNEFEAKRAKVLSSANGLRSVLLQNPNHKEILPIHKTIEKQYNQILNFGKEIEKIKGIKSVSRNVGYFEGKAEPSYTLTCTQEALLPLCDYATKHQQISFIINKPKSYELDNTILGVNTGGNFFRILFLENIFADISLSEYYIIEKEFYKEYAKEGFSIYLDHNYSNGIANFIVYLIPQENESQKSIEKRTKETTARLVGIQNRIRTRTNIKGHIYPIRIGHVESWYVAGIAKPKNQYDYKAKKEELKNYFSGLGSLGRAFDEVRSKGVLIKDGITYKRQKPITKMLKGKETTISFAFNRIVKGFYGIIEAKDLQPSHSTGVQNPYHFLPEAQPRNRSTSQSGRETPQLIARNLRPAEIIEGANAYTGAPIANLRGEVIQGNGRADTLKIYYSLEPNGKIYKNYFFDGCNANFLGFSARTIKSELAKFKKPILGRFCDVSDEEFIQLGQFQAKDLEAVSSESSDTKVRVNRISETDLAKMIDALLRYDKGDDSLTEIIRNSNALAYFVKAKVLRADELEKYTKNGQANAQGTEFVRQFLLQFLFEQGKDTKTSQKFENLPHHTQKGVEKSLLYVLKVHCYADCDSTDHSITKEVSNAIGAAYDFLQQSTFNFPAWVKQTPVFEPSPKDRFSPLELELAKVFSEGKTQKDIVDKFKKYAYYATDRPATMLEKEEKALSKNEALQKAFSISLSGLGCTSSCACQKKGLNGCECDNDDMHDWWSEKKKSYGIKSDMNKDGIISTPKKEVGKEPYQMTFNTYMHLDNIYKKHFNRLINVEREVEKERIFDKEKRAKAISWREKQYKILLNTTRELLRERHQHEVEKALSEGKTVPSEVLKDYPNLQQKPTSTTKKEVESNLSESFKKYAQTVEKKLKTINDRIKTKAPYHTGRRKSDQNKTDIHNRKKIELLYNVLLSVSDAYANNTMPKRLEWIKSKKDVEDLLSVVYQNGNKLQINSRSVAHLKLLERSNEKDDFELFVAYNTLLSLLENEQNPTSEPKKEEEKKLFFDKTEFYGKGMTPSLSVKVIKEENTWYSSYKSLVGRKSKEEREKVKEAERKGYIFKPYKVGEYGQVYVLEIKNKYILTKYGLENIHKINSTTEYNDTPISEKLVKKIDKVDKDFEDFKKALSTQYPTKNSKYYLFNGQTIIVKTLKPARYEIAKFDLRGEPIYSYPKKFDAKVFTEKEALKLAYEFVIWLKQNPTSTPKKEVENKPTSTQKPVWEKEVYEMTFNEFADFKKQEYRDESSKSSAWKRPSQASIKRLEKLNHGLLILKYTHSKAIEKALSEGKTVPNEVLKDYPELMPSTPKNEDIEPYQMTFEEFDKKTVVLSHKVLRGVSQQYLVFYKSDNFQKNRKIDTYEYEQIKKDAIYETSSYHKFELKKVKINAYAEYISEQKTTSTPKKEVEDEGNKAKRIRINKGKLRLMQLVMNQLNGLGSISEIVQDLGYDSYAKGRKNDIYLIKNLDLYVGEYQYPNIVNISKIKQKFRDIYQMDDYINNQRNNSIALKITKKNKKERIENNRMLLDTLNLSSLKGY